MIKPLHQQFVLKYLELQDGAKAYQHVYPKSSPATAKVNASVLLKKPEIRAYLQEMQDEIATKGILKITDILQDLSTIARSSSTSTSNRLRAYHQISGMLGAYKENININRNVTANTDNLTDEELEELVKKLTPKSK